MKRSFRRALAGAALAAAFAAVAACSSPEKRLAKYLDSGESYLEDGRLGAANVQFLNALKIDQENLRALKGLEKIAEAKRDYQQMYGLLQRINRIDPKDVGVRLDLAKIRLLSGDSAAALDGVNSVLDEEPQNAEALAVKAAVQFRLDNAAESVELAKKALAIKPGLEDAIAILASARIKAQDDEGALAILDDAIKTNPNSNILGLMRIQVLDKLGRVDELGAAYLALINTDPKNVNYRRLYVTQLMKENKLAEARDELVEVAKLVPKQRDAKLDVVRLDYRIGGREKAEETLTNLIKENPDDIDLKFSLGAFLSEQKDYDKADALYRGIINEKGAELSNILRAKNEIATIRLAQGRKDDAKKLINEILAADPKDPDALVKRASLDIDARKYDDAIADLRVVASEKPELSSAHLLLAAAFEAQGDVNLAESELATAVDKSGRAERESGIFAQFLLRQGKKDRAEKVLTDSLAAHPASANNLKMLAAIRLDNQDWRGAEEVANALKALPAEDSDASAILGAAYTGLKDYAGAIDVLTKANDKSPLAARPLANLVAAYTDAGRVDEAQKLLTDTIAQNPKSYEPRILLAGVQRRQNHIGEAKETLRAAIDLDPLRPDAYMAMYDAYKLEGRLNDAALLIDQGLAAIPNNVALQMLKADVDIALRKPDEAIAIYETILTRRPNDLIVANNLSSLLSMRDDEASIERAAKIAEPLKDIDSPFYQDTYGWALYRAGRKEEGVAALEKAAAGEPNLVDARYHLGVALMETGQAVRGKSELEAVIAKAPNSPYAADARKRLGL